MKRFYEEPELEVVKFSVEDIITASAGGDTGDTSNDDQYNEDWTPIG